MKVSSFSIRIMQDQHMQNDYKVLELILCSVTTDVTWGIYAVKV